MPIDDLTALGYALRAARKEKNLTQEQLADESHVSTKQIADIEKARRNPSYLILKALAKVVHLSLDSLMYPDLSPDEAGQNEAQDRHLLLHKNNVTIQTSFVKPLLTQLKFYSLRLLRHINYVKCPYECKHSTSILS